MQTNHTPDTNKLCLFARAFLLISYYFPLLLICWSNVWIQHAATCRDLNYPAGISSNAWHAAPFLYASSFVLSSSLIRILDQPVRTIEHQLSPNLTKRVKYFGHDKKKSVAAAFVGAYRRTLYQQGRNQRRPPAMKAGCTYPPVAHGRG